MRLASSELRRRLEPLVCRIPAPSGRKYFVESVCRFANAISTPGKGELVTLFYPPYSRYLYSGGSSPGFRG